jgi:hypothetical protein
MDAVDQIVGGITMLLPPEVVTQNTWYRVPQNSVNQSLNCRVKYDANLILTSFTAELATTCVN